MPTEEFEKFEESVEVEERVDQIERILPTLSTKRHERPCAAHPEG